MKNYFNISIRFGKKKKPIRIAGFQATESMDGPTICIDDSTGKTYLVSEERHDWRLYRLLHVGKDGFAINRMETLVIPKSRI